MARISGITTKKDIRGNITKVTIDAKKHPEAIGKLKDLGIIEKTDFEKKFSEGSDIDDVFDRLIQHIDNTWREK